MDKKRLFSDAASMGIDFINIIAPSRFDDLKKILSDRRKSDHVTEFEGEDIDKRIDPYITMEDVKSIIVLGINYYRKDDYEISNKGSDYIRGQISRCSWGKDYHQILMDIMNNLSGNITDHEEGSECKCFVDTGPLVDRHLGYESSMGFYGMNNAIINKDIGSFMFIGYILTNKEFDVSKSECIPNGCGDCTRCIDACPTNALLGDHGYNPKKCIAYLTQTKKYISYDLREKMGKSLYGCDICQIVCPYNKDIKPRSDDIFRPNYELVYPSLKDMALIGKKEFNNYYSTMALGWRGKNVIVRNALIAMGNSSKEDYLDILRTFLSSPSKMLREYSAWALARIGTTQSFAELIEFIDDKEIGDEIKKLLQYYGK